MGIAIKEYVPSHLYEINKYLTDYIYNTGNNFTIKYSYNGDVVDGIASSTVTTVTEKIRFTIRKGPGYESNAPKLVSREYGTNKILEFMSPTLLLASYSEILEMNINGPKDMELAYTFFTCGDLGGTLKLVKPDEEVDVGIFNLVATLSIQAPTYSDTVNYYVNDLVNFSTLIWKNILPSHGKAPNVGSPYWEVVTNTSDTETFTYYNYHVDPVINDLTDIQGIDWNDFLDNSPDLEARLCALHVIRSDSSNILSIFDQSLKDSSLFNDVSSTCDTFIKDIYCKTQGAQNHQPKYNRACSCLTKNATGVNAVHFEDEDEEYLYYSLKKSHNDIPVKCVNSYCRRGGYYNNEEPTCPNVCPNGNTELCERKNPDKTVTKGPCCDVQYKTLRGGTQITKQKKVISLPDKIIFVPSPEEQAEEDKKQAELEQENKKNQDAEDEKNKKNQAAEDEKNKNIVNNFLNIQRNINSQKFTLIMSIVIIFMFFLGSVFLLYKIINKKK